MSIIQPQLMYQDFQNYESYFMSLKKEDDNISITLLMDSDLLTTKSLPETYNLLLQHFPKVLKTKCFNDLNIPFHEEVKNTEIGHLFEHIMLGFLCELKVKNGSTRASFRGITEWDWKKDAMGTFHITIGIKAEDIQYIKEAYENSHKILKLILLSKDSISIN